MKKCAVIFWMVFMSWGTAGAIRAEDQIPLRILYVGANKSPRADQFADFFKKRFANVIVADRDGFKPAAAEDADVVVLDWSQSEGGLDKTAVPFGRLEDWTKPTVLLNHSGLLVAGHWQLIGGAG